MDGHQVPEASTGAKAGAQANTCASEEASLWEDPLPWVEGADAHEHGADRDVAWSLDSGGYVPAVEQKAISPSRKPFSPLTTTEPDFDAVGPGRRQPRRGRRLSIGVTIVSAAGAVLGPRRDGHGDAASTVDSTTTVSAGQSGSAHDDRAKGELPSPTLASPSHDVRTDGTGATATASTRESRSSKSPAGSTPSSSRPPVASTTRTIRQKPCRDSVLAEGLRRLPTFLGPVTLRVFLDDEGLAQYAKRHTVSTAGLTIAAFSGNPGQPGNTDIAISSVHGRRTALLRAGDPDLVVFPPRSAFAVITVTKGDRNIVYLREIPGPHDALDRTAEQMVLRQLSQALRNWQRDEREGMRRERSVPFHAPILI